MGPLWRFWRIEGNKVLILREEMWLVGTWGAKAKAQKVEKMISDSVQRSIAYNHEPVTSPHATQFPSNL